MSGNSDACALSVTGCNDIRNIFRSTFSFINGKHCSDKNTYHIIQKTIRCNAQIYIIPVPHHGSGADRTDRIGNIRSRCHKRTEIVCADECLCRFVKQCRIDRSAIMQRGIDGKRITVWRVADDILIFFFIDIVTYLLMHSAGSGRDAVPWTDPS